MAVLALLAAREVPVGWLVSLILAGLFFVDATLTLMRRLIRGERVSQAHRSHAYQWLARRWRSHRRVTLLAIGLNFFWLLPSALLAGRYPDFAGWIVVGALTPIVAGALLAGAGRNERAQRRAS
jgi:Fuc2NAc and GlcNAc transferase